MTHDYERHGTTTVFAAMNILDGTVIGRNMQRHRHPEFIRFLNVIEKQVPVGKTVPSSTITPPISIPMFADGSNAIRDGRFISPRHRLPGSTPSRASSQPSQSAGSKRGVFRSKSSPQSARAPSVRFDPLALMFAVKGEARLSARSAGSRRRKTL